MNATSTVATTQTVLRNTSPSPILALASLYSIVATNVQPELTLTQLPEVGSYKGQPYAKFGTNLEVSLKLDLARNIAGEPYDAPNKHKVATLEIYHPRVPDLVNGRRDNIWFSAVACEWILDKPSENKWKQPSLVITMPKIDMFLQDATGGNNLAFCLKSLQLLREILLNQ